MSKATRTYPKGKLTDAEIDAYMDSEQYQIDKAASFASHAATRAAEDAAGLH